MAGVTVAGVTQAGANPAGAIRVAIVDDHPIVRDGTAALLRRQPGIEVIGTAATVGEAASLLASAEVDVVLLDIRLGSESGLALLDGSARRGGGRRPDTAPAIVVVSAYDYPQYADAAMRLGAAGYVVKTAPLGELVEAIRRAAAGGLAYSIRPPSGAPRLTRREREVVVLVAEGRTNDEVAGALGIGVKTVETHLRRIFERFGVGSRTELVARAVREGWLEVPLDA